MQHVVARIRHWKALKGKNAFCTTWVVSFILWSIRNECVIKTVCSHMQYLKWKQQEKYYNKQTLPFVTVFDLPVFLSSNQQNKGVCWGGGVEGCARPVGDRDRVPRKCTNFKYLSGSLCWRVPMGFPSSVIKPARVHLCLWAEGRVCCYIGESSLLQVIYPALSESHFLLVHFAQCHWGWHIATKGGKDPRQPVTSSLSGSGGGNVQDFPVLKKPSYTTMRMDSKQHKLANFTQSEKM